MSWWRAFFLLMGSVSVGVMVSRGFECVEGPRLAAVMSSCFYLGVLVDQAMDRARKRLRQSMGMEA